MSDFFYRYVDEMVGDEYSSHPRIRLLRLDVAKRTPMGAWVQLGRLGKKRFVLNDSRKRYAHPTEAEALQSFIARKRRQKSIYAARHDHAEIMLRTAEVMLERGLSCDSPALAPFA